MICRLVRCLLSAVVLLSAGAAPALASQRPNFVFVIADDQRWDALSCVQKEQGEKGRFPWLRTPNMDRLASQGVRFRNAFVVDSLCSPSRAAFLTGQYNHRNGICNNKTALPADTVTFAGLLRAAGYATGYVGKWHMGSQSGQRPGFDWSASFVGQGVYFDCPFEINGERTPTKGWTDDVSTDYAIDFLQKNKDGPFLLVLGFKSPHGPFTPPPRHQKTYEGELARAVPNLTAVPPFVEKTKKLEMTDGKVPVNLDYFRCIGGIDDNLGRLLDALDRLGLSDNTVVVYVSDNGYYLGEHGLGDKRSAYEESLRIPMLVRYPGVAPAGVTRDQMVLNIDLAPTLLDLAGLPVPKTMQGRTWRPLLGERPDAAAWRQSFFYEYFYERSKKTPLGRGGFGTPTITAVRAADAALIRYPGHDDWTEVFDLQADPYETNNLAGDAAHAGLRQRLDAELERLKKELGYKVPEGLDDPPRPTPVRAEGWVLDYDFTGDEGNFVEDTSGAASHGKAVAAARVRTGDQTWGRKFTGKGHIEVPVTESLSVADTPWLVEVKFKAGAGDGVLVARGGATAGFALYLADGKPNLVVNTRGKPFRAGGKQAVTGTWTTVSAALTAAGEARLYVDGELADRVRLPGSLPKEPNDGMEIGADLSSPVDEQAAASKFQGIIDRVRMYRGKDLPLPQ